MKKFPSVAPEQNEAVRRLRSILRNEHPEIEYPDAKARAELKKQAKYRRVDAIAKMTLPILSPDELKRLGRLIRTELAKRPPAPKPSNRPPVSQEDREKLERQAHEMFVAFTRPPFGYSNNEADDAIALTLFADRRTAQRYRKVHADRLKSSRDRKSRKK